MSFAMHTCDCFVKIKMADKTDEKKILRNIFEMQMCIYLLHTEDWSFVFIKLLIIITIFRVRHVKHTFKPSKGTKMKIVPQDIVCGNKSKTF